VSTLPEVDVPGEVQRLGQPTAEEERTGEHQSASPTGEAAGC
jgi:hypothetical protein